MEEFDYTELISWASGNACLKYWVMILRNKYLPLFALLSRLQSIFFWMITRATPGRVGLFLSKSSYSNSNLICQHARPSFGTLPLSRCSQPAPAFRSYHEQTQRYTQQRPTHTYEGHSLNFSLRSSYNAELDRAARANDLEQLLRILRTMEERGETDYNRKLRRIAVAQDRATFDILLKFYSSRDDEGSMLQCLQSMREKVRGKLAD